MAGSVDIWSEGLSAVAVFLDCAAVVSEVDGRRIVLKFKRYPGAWIYCNYPEHLPAAALGDSGLGNKYLNRVFVDGEAQLFASYLNATGGDLFFGVLLHNPGNATARVVRQAVGHRHSGKYPDWCDIQGGVWGDFFNSCSEEIFAIHSRESVWIFEGPAPNNKFFNTVLALQTDMLLECLVYIYRNRANIDGTATCFPWTPGSKQYRGVGDSYAIESDLGLHLSRMPCHYYTCRCGNNPDEITPIYDTCADAWRCCTCPDKNLGNWGLHYLFQVVVVNDTDAARVVRSYMGSDGGTPGADVVVRFGNLVKWCCLNRKEWWNWLVDYIPAGQSRVYKYQFIHAANSTAPVLHGWQSG
jgi:hypothetical protein